MVSAVKAAEATPEEFVATVIAVRLLLNTPEAPPFGAVKVTFTPETGLLPASLTATARALENALFTVALCGVVPAFAVIDDAGPAVFVNEKFTGVTPLAAAVTV